jgi:phosphoglycolate phosphatase
MISLPELIVFDLDGTLADTIEDIAASVNRVLSRFGLPCYNSDTYKRMVGDGFRTLIERCLPPTAVHDEVLFAEIFESATREYAAHCLEKTKPYPGMRSTLEALSRKGVRQAVLSNKPDDMSKAIVQALFGAVPFVAVWGNSPQRPRKPDPSAVLAICKIAGARPEHSLFVGDSGVDMKTARAAGMIGVAALYGYRSKEELEKAGADYFIEAPEALLSLLHVT